MKFISIIFILFSFSNISFAQEDIEKSKESRSIPKWTIQFDIGIGEQGERKLSVEQGFRVDYLFAKKWQIGTELKYAIYRGDFYHTLEETERNDMNEIIEFTVVAPESASYFQIPINISFRQKWMQFTLGLSNCFLANVRGKIISNDPRSSDLFLGNASSRNIVEYGFRPFHLRAHVSATFITKKRIGCRLKIFQPITNLGKVPEEIPSGNPLFLDKDRPGGFSFHLLYIFPKIKF